MLKFLILTSIMSLGCIIEGATGARPRGIFIQVTSAHTYVLPWLERWLDNICRRNKEVGPNEDMNDLVLQDLATYHSENGTYTMRWEVLDKILPYLPGGSKQCFGNVFVGTIGLNWKGAEYSEDMKDRNYIQKQIDLSHQVMNEFVTKYNGRLSRIHLYVTHEANINYLIDEAVCKGYEDLFTGIIRNFISISPGSSVMWSPAFWQSFESVSDSNKARLRNNLYNLFRNTRSRASPGVNWMNLQDTQGRGGMKCSGVKVSPIDAVEWYRFIRDSYSFRSIQVNQELFYFDENDNCNMKEVPSERQIERQDFYERHQVRLGAAFEIRYWRERW